MMNRLFYRLGLIGLMVVATAASHFTQRGLNQLRSSLQITRLEPLENAPPMLAFTTVAMGGFRGLIANYLWMRAADHQENGRYFEMISLANWITKLQPTFAAVWNQQAWNMVYNISTQLQDPHERWLWVKSGIELLRDDGLRYNPMESELYRELASIYYDKMGGTLDTAHHYFKEAWATQMVQLLGREPDLEALAGATDPESQARVAELESKYRLNIQTMVEVDTDYGPLDWRLPETHAIYWAHVGLQKSKKGRLNFLRRVIWQSLILSFKRGKLVENFADRRLEYAPNLELVTRVDEHFKRVREEEEDPDYYSTIDRANLNFLKDAVYLLYTHNRLTDAAHWYGVLQERFPDDKDGKLSLDQFAVERTEAQIDRAHSNEIRVVIEGLLENHFYNLALGEEDRALGLNNLAQKIWNHFNTRIRGQNERIGLLPFPEMRQLILERVLNGETQVSAALIAQLRSRLGIGATAPDPAPQP